jgi:hypothetical protein
MALPLQVVPFYTPPDNRGGMAQALTGWNDLAGSVQAGAGVSALTTEVYRDTPFLMSFFRHDQNDSLSFIYQMSHAWQPGTVVRPHVHVVPMADPVATQNVYIIGQYAWGSTTRVLPANASWTAFTITFAINPGDAFQVKVIDTTNATGITPPADIDESDILCVYFQRNGANVLDTYTTGKTGGTAAANLGLLSFDCHFQIQKVGSLTEFDG